MQLTLLVGVERLCEYVIASKDHDDGKILINQGQDTMLKLTGHDSFAMKVGYLFDLQGTYICKISSFFKMLSGQYQRTFKSRRELTSSSEKQQALLVLEEFCAQFFDRLVELQNMLKLFRDLSKSFHDILPSLLL